jgi:hypothetical protein
VRRRAPDVAQGRIHPQKVSQVSNGLNGCDVVGQQFCRCCFSRDLLSQRKGAC